MRKNISPALGFAPMTFRLASSSKENLPNRDLCSWIDHFTPIGSRSLNKTTPMAARACSFDCSVLASKRVGVQLLVIIYYCKIYCAECSYCAQLVSNGYRCCREQPDLGILYIKVLLKDSSGLD